MPVDWIYRDSASEYAQWRTREKKLTAKRRAKWDAMRAAMIAKRTRTEAPTDA